MTDESGRARWQRAYDQAKKRDADFTTLSGLPVEPVYGPPDGTEPAEAIGGGVPVYQGPVSHRLPGQAVDDQAVFRLRQRQAD
jgi:hypothetical protein